MREQHSSSSSSSSSSSTQSTSSQHILKSLQDGLSGSIGASISNLATYPLDLIITRLQIQHQIQKNKSSSLPSSSSSNSETYTGLIDAFTKIYDNDGLSGFYTGILSDTTKTVADSFIFFLLYDLLRTRQLRRHGPGTKGLPAYEELAVGFVAGAVTKAFTTPIANVSKRQQAASLNSGDEDGDSDDDGSEAGKRTDDREGSARRDDDDTMTTRTQKTRRRKTTPSMASITSKIRREHGISGFWAGYSASLILTLNPSITFFLFEFLKRIFVPRSRRDNPPFLITFLLAASSKACASTITYPFSLAKTRLQSGAVNSSRERNDENETAREVEEKAEKNTESEEGKQVERKVARTQRHSLMSIIMTIIRTEGTGALYEGVRYEVLKAFLSHGITMTVKQVISRFTNQAAYILGILLNRYATPVVEDINEGMSKLAERAKEAKGVEFFDLGVKRVGEKAQMAVDQAKVAAEQVVQEAKKRANEVAEFVGEYVEDSEEKGLYGETGLAKWLGERFKEGNGEGE